MNWKVHKFGGTSVADASRYKNVGNIIQAEAKRPQAVVVSAMSKVTDALIELAHLAEQQSPDYLNKMELLLDRHKKTVAELLPNSSQGQLRSELVEILKKDFNSLAEILKGVWHLKNCSEKTLEWISGFGEIWSAQFLNAHLQLLGQKSVWLDARQVLVVESRGSGVSVLWEVSQKKLDSYFQSLKSTPDFLIITGFVASTLEGVATTLQRNGSDFSASIFGSLLKAESVVIWTDVDGVLSADPRLVPEAIVLEDMSYMEATELAYFGAKVVHPSTMAPVIKDKIPIWIKNSFRPEAPGTLIHTHSNSKLPVKGFSTIENIGLINLTGTGMMGVPGVAQNLFSSLREVGVSVIMISQASSEQSICVAVPLAQAQKAKEAASQAFAFEIQSGLISKVDLSTDCSILAAVGDNMVERPGLAGQFFASLGRAGINIQAIAQGSSERNISVVISRSQMVKALRTVHAQFFLSPHTISIGLLGPGVVGGAFLRQLENMKESLRGQLKIDLQVRALANSKKMILSERPLLLSEALQKLQASEAPLDLAKFAKHVKTDHLPHSVILDCTSSQEISNLYQQWLAQGIHVITPNKKSGSGDAFKALEVSQIIKNKSVHFLYETTVGAGLPLLITLRELIRTGDEVKKVEGVLSGTLSYLFNSFDQNRKFSEVLLEAKAKGFTEPDPRDDLSGLDVARKLVILGREMGLNLSLDQVEIDPLLPVNLVSLSLSEFMGRISELDGVMLKKWQEAENENKVLRFVGFIDSTGKARVSLQKYSKSHAFSRLSFTDNIVAFTTSRYTQPLIVQGPGAGPEVTAAGLFADLLRLCSYLGAPL